MSSDKKIGDKLSDTVVNDAAYPVANSAAAATVVTMTLDQLTDMITKSSAAAVEQALARLNANAAAQLPGQAPQKNLTIDEMFEATAAAQKGTDRAADPCEHFNVVSPDTFATFDAVVFHGRVIRLENYTHPAGAFKYAKEGGFVPDGFTIYERGEGSPMLASFKQWLYESYWQADLKRFIGKPLPGYLRQAAAEARAQ